MTQKIKLRNDLNADILFSQVRSGFEKIPDHRSKNITISLPDALMSGFATAIPVLSPTAFFKSYLLNF